MAVDANLSNDIYNLINSIEFVINKTINAVKYKYDMIYELWVQQRGNFRNSWSNRNIKLSG